MVFNNVPLTTAMRPTTISITLTPL